MNKRSELRMKLWGAVSILPLFAFTTWTIYLMFAAGYLPPAESYLDHRSISALVTQNYAGLLVALLLAFALAGFVLTTFVLHLHRLQTISRKAKVFWIVFMCCFGAFSFPVFWNSFLRHEPEYSPELVPLS